MVKLLLIVITILLTVGGQLCFKKAASLGLSLSGFANHYTFLGLFLYGLSTVAYLNVLRLAKLSVVFPLVFGGVALLLVLSAKLLFKESLNFIQLIGVVFIVLGVVCCNFKV